MATASARPADGPSFGTAPSGTWTRTSWLASSRPSLGQNGERRNSGLRPRSLDVGEEISPRRRGRLLHDVTELTGQDQLAAPASDGRLDGEDLSPV